MIEHKRYSTGSVIKAVSESQQPLIIFVLQCLIFWAVWSWMAARIWTSGDEAWGVVSLLAAIFFAMRPGQTSKAANKYTLIFSSLLTLFYIASFSFAPRLVRAIIAMTALTITLSSCRFGRKFHLGLYALLLLGLPVMASMNFFLGFPLRVVIGEAVEFLLKLQGLAVWREGVCLHFGEKMVWIDAPCSGIKMLWFGMFLTAVLVCFYRLGNLRTMAAFLFAFVSILLGNIFRASSLFYTESGLIEAPDWMHDAVGVLAFAVTAAGIAAAVVWLKGRAVEPTINETKPEAAPTRYLHLYTFFLVIAFAATFVVTQGSTISHTSSFRGFPTELDGLPIKELELTEREKYFLEEFPGRIGRFSDGRREIVIRWVTEATRKLHSSEDCFNAFGYRTKPLPIKIDEDGKRWGCFSARKGDDSLRVCQRIADNDGNQWTDVSAWYWSAFNSGSSEWWAYTVAERE